MSFTPLITLSPHLQQPLFVHAVQSQAQLRQVDDRIEVAAEREVVTDVAVAGDLDQGVLFHQEGGNVLDGDSGGAALLDLDRRHHQSGRRIEADRGHRLGDRHHPGLRQYGGHTDRTVSAHRQAPRTPR
ncbi:hypothetical protein BFV98_00015 [Micromonospora sp. WMMB235]|nr:hypothetical protein BFV98_00015 [Micromonospora sp. WMMB235]